MKKVGGYSVDTRDAEGKLTFLVFNYRRHFNPTSIKESVIVETGPKVKANSCIVLMVNASIIHVLLKSLAEAKCLYL